MLADQTIQPYTDLLLHDMGAGPGRRSSRLPRARAPSGGRPRCGGIGLSTTVNGERFLLHDGRARTLEEAILWHGGEGERSRDAFRALDADERAELVRFLESL